METIVDTIEFLVTTGICSSKREARQMVSNGAIRINGSKMTSNNFIMRTKDKHKHKE